MLAGSVAGIAVHPHGEFEMKGLTGSVRVSRVAGGHGSGCARRKILTGWGVGSGGLRGPASARHRDTADRAGA